ncbi:MAG: LysR family transcriptional regulator [Thomasclavelia sp.]|nr:LysR family transcriptional regulator [Thomasclavelia sp.]
MYIKLEQYKIFNEAASTLSFSEAARNLFISQSAVSQTIHTLEKELNTQLFIRKSKGVILTKDGELLYENISKALNIINDVENNLSLSSELSSGELIIGSSDTFLENYLMPVVNKYHLKYPNIKIKIINRTTLETIELIRSGQIDIGFLNLPINDDSLIINKCIDVHDIFVSNKKTNHKYSLNDVSKMPLILLEQNSNTRKFLDSYFNTHNLNLNPIIELGAHESLVDFAKAGIGNTCVIKEFIQDELNKKELYEIKLSNDLPQRSIGYAYLKSRILSNSTKAFIDLLNN